MSNSKRQNQSKQYTSIYGAEGFITGQQYVAELIISRQSKFLKETLPNKFWSNPQYIDWGKKYLNQLRRVNAIIKAGFSLELIIEAINSYEGRYLCSLFNKKLDFILTKLDREKQISMIKDAVESNPENTPNSSESNSADILLSKLDISSTTSKQEEKKHKQKQQTISQKQTRISKLREED